ncbi:MAG: protein kinase domain-containing protein [Polyangiales bacterium]
MYPQPGEIVEGKYRIDRMLGEGAMGGVFAATHTIRRASVALKFMSEQASAMPEAVDRFMNEAVSASQIESDHVVKIFDVGRWGQLPYLVMEFLEGHDLAHEVESQVRARAQIPVARAVHFTLQILRAMQVAHHRGIVHRDLKPANAFVVTKDGEPDFVKVLDFGISKLSEPGAVHLTKTTVSMGTPLYMAPEQAKSARDADSRSDVYSVAAILYELLTGRPPHEADNYNLLLFKLFQEEPPNLLTLRNDLPPGFAEVVHKGLSKDPATRIQSATEFGALLAPFADTRSSALLARMLARTGGERMSLLQPSTMSMPTPAPKAEPAATITAAAQTSTTFGPRASSPPPPPKASKVPTIVGVAALVAALGIGAFVVIKGREPAKDPPAAPATAKPTAEEKVTQTKPVETAAPPPSAEPSASVSATATATAKKQPAAPWLSAAPAKSTAPTAVAPDPTATTKKKKLDWELSK